MSFNFFFGPNKIPFTLTDNGMVEHCSAMPFHGIISRGLLNKFIKHKLHLEFWNALAPVLSDQVISGTDKDFALIKNLAKECCVLSFSNSSFCAKKYVEQYCSRLENIPEKVELWNIKEGHTSSVWKTTIEVRNERETFIVNVARDQEAGIELNESSEKIRKIGNKYPNINLAKVFEISLIKDCSLPFAVTVTRNDWIENSFEIHQRINKSSGQKELLMVERFLTDEDDPAQIISVLGRKFSVTESLKINSELNNFLNLASECLIEKPEININDGDLVWSSGKAFVVAIN